MPIRKLFRILFAVAILTAGVWLLGRPGILQPEGAARLRALNTIAQGGPSTAAPASLEERPHRVVHDAVTPAIVNFAEVPAEADPADSMYERWLRGEIDIDENEGMVSEAEMARMREEALKQLPDPTVQQAQSTGEGGGPAPAAPSPGVSWDSISFSESGQFVPPDPEVAVGPNHVIAAVNVAVAIYNKAGVTVMPPTVAGNLFSQTPCNDTSGLYDPNVIYDEEADRWMLAYAVGAWEAVGGYCMLVSAGSDPSSTWYEYFFDLNSSTEWLDFPHAGVGDNHLFMGANFFRTSNGQFNGGRIYAFDKSELYAGNPVSAIERDLGAAHSTPQPLRLHGYQTGTWPNYGDAHYFLTDPWDGRFYPLVRWNAETDTVTTIETLDLGAGGQTVFATQNGTGLIEANDFRPLDFEYRNGHGWMTQNISCNPGSGVVNCIRWAQIDLDNGQLGPAGTGTFASNDRHRIFPDLAVNHCDDMAVGYTRTGSSEFPSIWVTGRKSGDAAGQLQAEAQLKAGELAYVAFDGSPHRWGDYTGMTIDPNGETFWYLGQYSKNTGNPGGRWGTYIGSFSYNDCEGEPGDPQISVDPGDFIISQAPDRSQTRTLNIENNGDMALTWTIEEAGVTPSNAPALAPEPAAPPGASLSEDIAAGGLWTGDDAPAPARAPRTVTGDGAIVYANRNAFNAENPGLLTEDFEAGKATAGAILTCTGPIDAAADNNCVAPGAILPGIALVDDPGPGPGQMIMLGAGALGAPSIAVGANQYPDALRLNFNPPVTAVGLDLQSRPGSGNLQLTIYAADGVTEITTETAFGNSTGVFWGIRAPEPIGAIEIFSPSEQAEVVDNITFGVPINASCSDPGNVPWLTLSPTAGNVPGNSSAAVDVTINTTGLDYGDYFALICIHSNDPVDPLISVPVDLTVAEDYPAYLPVILKP